MRSGFAVVLGFRIALRNGLQWSRPTMRRAKGVDTRDAARTEEAGDDQMSWKVRAGIQAVFFGVGGLIHVAVGLAGGTGGFFTKRPGFSSNA